MLLKETTQKLATEIAELKQNIAEIKKHSQSCLKSQDLLSKKIDAIQERISFLNEAILEIKNELTNIHLETGKESICKIDAIWDSIFHNACPVDVRVEREYYKNFFADDAEASKSKGIEFLNLVYGLDKESVDTVIRSLQRLSLIKQTDEPFIPFYTQEEREVFQELKENFWQMVFQVDQDRFYYNSYMLPVNYFEACVFWFKCGVPFLEHPERFADKDIIDAGAFIGDSALILSPLTTRFVYAFEPMPSNYKLLLKTLDLNSLTNVVPCHTALGEKSGTAAFSVGANGSASSQFIHDGVNYHEKAEVNITTLDEYVKEHNLNVGLVKVDVEGAEQLLLRGAIETIKKQRPALIISIYHNAQDYFGIKPWLESMNLGYHFKIRHPACGTIMTETVLIAEVP